MVLHGVQGEFPDDVSGAVVGPIFTVHVSERKWLAEWDDSLFRGGVGFAAGASLPILGTPASETSLGNSPRTPCRDPKTKNQYLFHGESLKSRILVVLVMANWIQRLQLTTFCAMSLELVTRVFKPQVTLNMKVSVWIKHTWTVCGKCSLCLPSSSSAYFLLSLVCVFFCISFSFFPILPFSYPSFPSFYSIYFFFCFNIISCFHFSYFSSCRYVLSLPPPPLLPSLF
jgi:hypothetical protein